MKNILTTIMAFFVISLILVQPSMAVDIQGDRHGEEGVNLNDYPKYSDGVYLLYKDDFMYFGNKEIYANNINVIGRTNRHGATLGVRDNGVGEQDYASLFKGENAVLGGLSITVLDFGFDGTNLGKKSWMIIGLGSEIGANQGNVGNSMQFSVAVNDFPDHRDVQRTRNIANAYVNKYIVSESNGVYTVESIVTQRSEMPFNILPGEIVYFEGFTSRDAAESRVRAIGGNNYAAEWDYPPYKNFGTVNPNTSEVELCQVHFDDINKFLEHSRDYACATSLSVPYEVASSGNGRYIPQGDTRPGQGESENVQGSLLGEDGWYGLFEGEVLKHKTGLWLEVKEIHEKGVSLEVVNTGELIEFTQLQEVISFEYSGHSYHVEYNFGYLGEVRKVILFIVHDKEESELPIKIESPLVKEIENLNRERTTAATEALSLRATPCDGCKTAQGRCVPYGSRVPTYDESPDEYCGLDGKRQLQRDAEIACQNNYECQSNLCSGGSCSDFAEDLKATRGLLERLVSLLERIFGRI